MCKPPFHRSTPTTETPKQCVKSDQTQQQRHQNDVTEVVLMSLLLIGNLGVSDAM